MPLRVGSNDGLGVAAANMVFRQWRLGLPWLEGTRPVGGTMTRYVIGPDVALLLAERRAVIPKANKLLAPTLLRS
jgi:hypothetical protein